MHEELRYLALFAEQTIGLSFKPGPVRVNASLTGYAAGIERKQWLLRHEIFFADEPTAIAAGYGPCATCMKERYAVWKKVQAIAHNREDALVLYRTFLGLSAE